MKYKGEYLNEISFPIGGIGSGCFGIAGNGRFTDWEIFNRPWKGSVLGWTHIAVKAKLKDGRSVFKILNSDYSKDLTGTYSKEQFKGFGFGPENKTMAGFPHFKNLEFNGEFPIAKLTFSDDAFPADVILTVFNPFIPLDSANSSIPAGFFNIEFKSKTDDVLEYSVLFTVTNTFRKSVNKIVCQNNKQILYLTGEMDKDDINYGDMSLVSDCDDVYIMQYWYRGKWQDGIDVAVKDLFYNDTLQNRVYDSAGVWDSATMQCKLKSDEECRVRFILSWNVPNNRNYWSEKQSESWKNYYATVFGSSIDSAIYCIENFESLYSRTMAFKNALFDTNLDKAVIDAVSSALSVLKSPTVLRLQDGSFYAWEGVHELAGSCEGTCQHVWTYAYALSFLFPDLERSIRNNEFKYCLYDNGKVIFRMALPLGFEKLHYGASFDGQMGLIFKTYREWKISGDTEWLKSVWDNVKKALSYAWSCENEEKWDENKDGVLEGKQHHTLDMELFGASSWLEGMYLCALKAAGEMADFLGDKEASSEYAELFDNGYKWTRENLFNEEYFIQQIDIKDSSYIEKFNVPQYWYDESGELKYQIANGCEIDQMLGQWHADILGLGDVFDKQQIKIALESLYKYNFLSMSEQINTWRVFALNDEKGAIICSYPHSRPTIPIPYHSEVMTGFEYALAGLMIAEGMEKEGLDIIRAVRDRYDGKKRNPWNEIECGSNYARAMSSYALIPIYSGFKFDLPNKMIGFDPIKKGDFKCFFSIGTAWGTLSWLEDSIRIDISEGYLDINKLAVNVAAKNIAVDGSNVDFVYRDGIICFADTLIYKSFVIEL